MTANAQLQFITTSTCRRTKLFDSDRAAMGGAARAEYEAKYTAERNYQMLIQIYERAIQRGKVG